MRAFLAVELPSRVRESFAQVREQFPREPGWRWVKPETLHLTLRFLGEVDTPFVEELHRRTREFSSSHPSSELQFGDLGTFGPRRAPRTFWIAIEESPLLANAQGAVEEIVRDLGVKPDNKAWSPHVTLARRSRSAGDVPSDLSQIDALRALVGVEIHWSRIVLLESHLLPEGPQYREVWEAPFRPLAEGGSEGV
ncbi:MAG: RNA 2',3'-cyclic phosphodiesterase [Planctomycetota bacterium]